MNLTLDDLKNEWMARDRKLEASLRMNTLMLRETLLEKHSAKLGSGIAGNVFHILFTVPFLMFFGWFIVRHINQPEFLLPAVALQVWTVLMLALTIQQRSQIRNLDYSRPVLALQGEIEQIKIARLSTFKWSFLTGQILWWVPFVLVLFKGLLGVNLYTVSDFMPKFIAWNIAIGVAFIPIALWVSKLLVGRLGASPKFQQFTDGIAGSDIAVGREFLAKLEKFEKEPESK
ncbi:MAG: hypothetical protein JNN20_04535 [Betaproteobacteria bacterium]|nr:hypothetical protein [Betaproteobacteria bacterium]